MNINNSSRSKSSPGRVLSGSLSEMLQVVKSNLEFDCFDEEYLQQAEEICLIIAEIFVLPPTASVRINGNELTAETVKEVYSMLTYEDIITVMDNFETATYEIRFKKTYLRTALYNEVFERSSREINGIRKDLPGYILTRREQIEKRRRSSQNGKLYS